MKKLYTQVIAITIIAIMVMSCGSKKAHYTNVIPSDASMVISVNIMNIWNKSGFNDEQRKGAIQKMQDAMLSQMKNQNAVMEKLIKDPTKSGIDLKENIYFYTPATMGKSIYLLAKVSDYDDLYKTLENMPMDSANEVAFEKNSDVTIATFNDQFKCAFDDNVLLINFSADQASDSLVAQIKNVSNANINSNPAFTKMTSGKGDMVFMVEMNQIQELLLNELKSTMAVGNVTTYKDLYLISNLSFEEGRLQFVSEYFTENKDTEKQLNEYMSMVGEIGKTFISSFSSDVVMFMGMNINGEKTIDMVMKTNPELLNESNEQIVTLIDAMKSVNGNVVFGIEKTTNTPSTAIYMQTKDNTILNLIVNQRKSNGGQLTKVSENEYATNFGGNNKATLGFKDGCTYLKINELVSISNPLSASQFASEIGSSSAYILINVESIMKELAGTLDQFKDHNENYKMVNDMMSQISYIDCYSTKSNNTFVFNVYAKDKKTNILQTLTDFFTDKI